MLSYGKVEASACEALVWQDHLYVVLLCFLVLPGLLLFLLLCEEFQLVVLELFLKSLTLDVVFKNGLFVVFNLVLHAFDLPLLLL